MSRNAPVVAIGAAFGAATVTALAQLGLASGLAILIWRDVDDQSWATHLTWAAWLAAASTVIGGSVGARLAEKWAIRVTCLIAAGVGGFVTAPLVAIPAMRFAEAGISAAPFAAAATGVFAGVLLTAAGMVSRAVAINVSASIVLTWLLAALATFFPIGGFDGGTRLGIWGTWRDLAGEAAAGAVSLAPPLLLGSLLIGAMTAWVAGNGDTDTRIVGLSGAAGPLLLVVGYIAAGQSSVGVETQWNGIWSGLYATVAGLLGSLLVTALRKNPVVAGEAGPAPQPPAEPTYESIDRDDAWAGSDADYRPPTQYRPSDAAPEFPAPSAADLDDDITQDLHRPIISPAPEPAVEPAAEPSPEPAAEPSPEPAAEPEPVKPKKTKKSRKSKKEEPAPEPADDSESWVSGLKDPNNPDPYGFNDLDEPPEPAPEPKKRRFGRRKSD